MGSTSEGETAAASPAAAVGGGRPETRWWRRFRPSRAVRRPIIFGLWVIATLAVLLEVFAALRQVFGS